jgi:hypothetical protein
MSDYFCTVNGVFPNGRKWSTGRHITSGQSPSALLTTWANAWTAAWNDGANGFKLFYPVGTVVQSFTVATLGATMRQTAKISQAAALAGTNANPSLPAQVSVVLSWSSSSSIGRTKRGNQKLPAPAENEVVNDKIPGPSQTSLSVAANMVKTAITADGSTFFSFPRSDTSTGIPAYTKSVLDTVKCRDKVGSANKRSKKEPSTYV